MISRAHEGRRLGLVGQWLLALVVVGSALAIGTVHTLTLCIVTLLLGVSTTLLCANRRPYPARRAATILLVLGVGLTAFTALQCIPLPAGWVATLAPHNADIWSRALLPLGERGPSCVSISVDPIATHIQVVRGVAYLLAFVGALEIARSKRGIRFLTYVVIASGVIVMVAAFLHPALDQSKVFGLYAPRGEIFPRHIAPLLNANHLGAYLNIALCCAVVAALDPDLGRVRILPAALAVLLVGGQLWIASRGGVVAMMFGVLLVVSLRVLGSRRVSATPIIAMVVVAGGIAMAVFGQWDQAWLEFADTDTSKLRFFIQALPMLHAYPVWGAGRGTFESTFPEFRTGMGYIVFTNPENVLLQWTTEWGIPVGLVGLGVAVWALRPSIAITRGKYALGAWAALVAVGLHNLVDYSAETPAIVLALCCCAAIVVGGNAVESRVPQIKNRYRLAVVGSVTCLGLLLGVSALGKDLGSDRASLAGLRDDSSSLFDGAIRNAMLRHPAEPYLSYVGALHATRNGSSVIPWVEKTLERAPVYGSAHLLLARELTPRSPSQARLEDRLGMEQMDLSTTTVSVVDAAIARGLVTSFDDALELLPEGSQHVVVLGILTDRLAAAYPASSYRLNTLLLQLTLPPPSAFRQRAYAVLSDLREGDAAPWCSAGRPACLRDGLRAAERFQAADPTSCDARDVEANMRVEAGDAHEAFFRLQSFVKSIPEQGECLADLAQVAQAANLASEATQIIDQLAHASCANQKECVNNLTMAASIEYARGNQRRALAFYLQAADEAPERDDIAIHVADLALGLGMYSEASDAYRRLAARHPEENKYRDGVVKTRGGLLRYKVRDGDDVNSAPQ